MTVDASELSQRSTVQQQQLRGELKERLGIFQLQLLRTGQLTRRAPTR
jgi:hypothetical protein